MALAAARSLLPIPPGRAWFAGTLHPAAVAHWFGLANAQEAMARWFGLANAQAVMDRSDMARASQAVMGRWFGSGRVAQAGAGRWFDLASAQEAMARLDSRASVAPGGAADHRGNEKREDRQEHH